jgi:hypothetical protein
MRTSHFCAFILYLVQSCDAGMCGIDGMPRRKSSGVQVSSYENACALSQQAIRVEDASSVNKSAPEEKNIDECMKGFSFLSLFF